MKLTANLLLLLFSTAVFSAGLTHKVNTLRIGEGDDADVNIVINNGDVNRPYIQYDSTTSKFIISDDGGVGINLTNPLTTNGDLYIFEGGVATRLGIGSNGQVLTVAGGALSWATPAPQSPTTTEGDLVLRGATVDERYGAVATPGYVLTNNGTATKPTWQAPAGVTPTTTQGDIIVRGAASDERYGAVATSGYVLTNNGTGLKPTWQEPAYLTPTTTQGDLVVRGAAADEALPAVATAGYVLTNNGTGQKPTYQIVPNQSTVSTKGDIQTYSTVNASLAAGNDGEYLIADSSEATGLKWTDTLLGSLNAMSDWEDCTPTFSGLGTPNPANIDIQCRQVGDTLEMHGRFQVGAPSASPAKIILHDSLTIDRTKISATNTIVGQAGRNNATTAVSDYSIVLSGGSSDGVFFGMYNNATYHPFDNVDGSSMIGTNEYITFYFSVPIVGWTSGLDAAIQERVLGSFRGEGGASTSVTATTGKIPFTISDDPDNAWDGDEYTAKADGTFLASGAFRSSTSIAPLIFVAVDGVDKGNIGITQTSGGLHYFSGQVKVLKDEVISIRTNTTFTMIAGQPTNNHITISEIVDKTALVALTPKCQTKYLSVSVNATSLDNADLRFTGLTIGAKYIAYITGHFTHGNNSGDSRAMMRVRNNGVIIKDNWYRDADNNSGTTQTVNSYFTAAGTSLNTDLTNFNGGFMTITGDGVNETNIRLCTDISEETTEW